MDLNRKAAYYTLMDVASKNAYSNLALNHHMIINRPDSPAFVRELVYGVLENRMLLDYIIDYLVPSGSEKMRKSDVTILRMGIYQLRAMNSVPEYAAVSESVELAKRFARGREAFINGVLRNYIREREQISLPNREENLVRHLSIKYSYAEWIIELWIEQFGEEECEALLAAGNETPEVAIRINWLRVLRRDLKKTLEAKGFQVREGKICQDTLYVKGSGLLETRQYRDGLFSVQDESSLLAVCMLDPKKGETVMDVCAAPGGKTGAIGERMNNDGRIIAMDIYTRKLSKVEKELKRLGITNVTTKPWDATKVNSDYIGIADRVLVDAPCSGLGVIRRKPEIKYRKKTDEMEELPDKQLHILSAASRYVKPGGVLVYSTCTINPWENQRVINEFLRTHANFEKEEAVQLLPNINGTDGFFICKLQRIGDLVQ